jgi:hypothetical protein
MILLSRPKPSRFFRRFTQRLTLDLAREGVGYLYTSIHHSQVLLGPLCG